MGLPIISMFPLYDMEFNFQRLKHSSERSEYFSPADTLGIFIWDSD